MPDESQNHSSTLALSTKVEEDFVAPLTAVRGALEILRDYPDLGDAERLRFVSTALRSCHALERSVNELADSVYAAGQSIDETHGPQEFSASDDDTFAGRIQIHEDPPIMELDFSGLVFTGSAVVDEIHDVIDAEIERLGRKWYFLINFTDCKVWPEAWVAFAHRGKKISVNHALGTVRYVNVAPGAESENGEIATQSYPSRADAIAQIKDMIRQNT